MSSGGVTGPDAAPQLQHPETTTRYGRGGTSAQTGEPAPNHAAMPAAVFSELRAGKLQRGLHVYSTGAGTYRRRRVRVRTLPGAQPQYATTGAAGSRLTPVQEHQALGGTPQVCATSGNIESF